MSSVINIFNRLDLIVSHGDGVYIIDKQGKKYLDFVSGMATNALGYNNKYLNQALKNQIDKIWHCYNYYIIEEQERLAQRLVNRTFADKTFFCSSGLEAVEAMIKFATYHSYAIKENRQEIIALQGGFHGRSLLGSSLTHYTSLQKGLGKLLNNIVHVPRNDIQALRKVISNKTLAIILEPVQAEGGIHVLDYKYLKKVRELSNQYGILLCFDEVQCGYGRTGSLFHYEQLLIEPDMLTCAKGMGNGFPLGGCLMKDKIATSLPIGIHGSTYSGNPLAMTVGNAVLDCMEAEGFFDHVRKSGQYMSTILHQLKDQTSWMQEIRGIGLMWGIDIRKGIDAKLLMQKCKDNGLLISIANGRKTMRLVPPLIIKKQEIDEMAEKLSTIIF